MSIHMGLVMCAVAIIPFAPPTPIRFNLSGAGGNLKTHSPASHIILSCRAIYILLAACYSLSQLHSLYTCTLSRAMPMYSTEIHFVWRRQHSVSLRHDKMKIKQIDYRARVLPSRSFVKEKLTAVEIQLTMQRCLDSIVSKKKMLFSN